MSAKRLLPRAVARVGSDDEHRLRSDGERDVHVRDGLLAVQRAWNARLAKCGTEAARDAIERRDVELLEQLAALGTGRISVIQEFLGERGHGAVFADDVGAAAWMSARETTTPEVARVMAR